MIHKNRIGFIQPDGKVLSIFCYCGGSIIENGYILHNYYTSIGKIKRLVNLGSLRFIRPKIKNCDIYKTPHMECPPMLLESEEKFVDYMTRGNTLRGSRSTMYERIGYLWRPEGRNWWIINGYEGAKLTPLFLCADVRC